LNTDYRHDLNMSISIVSIYI